MNLRDVVVYCDLDFRIRKGYKKQDDVGAILIAAMHKCQRTLFFSTILVTTFFRPFLVLITAALGISIELKN
jgi:hypothetical protein